ncbi:MAG: hypothetical protein ABL958_10255 [Bdellovibrionia bacterium]
MLRCLALFAPLMIFALSAKAGTEAGFCTPDCTEAQCRSQVQSLMDSEDIVKISEEAERVEEARDFENVLKPQVKEAFRALKEFAGLPENSDDEIFTIPLDANARPVEFKKLSVIHRCFGEWVQSSEEGAAVGPSCSGNEGVTLQEIQFVLDHFLQATAKVSKDPVTLFSGPPPVPRGLRSATTIKNFLTLAKIHYQKKRKVSAARWKVVESKLKAVLDSLQSLVLGGIAVWKKTDDSATGHYIYRPLKGDSTRLDVVAIAKGLNCLKVSGEEKELPALLARLREAVKIRSQGERLPASAK